MFNLAVTAICRASSRHPYLFLLATLALCLPAGLQIPKIKLDTNLKRLLPESSAAVRWSEELEAVVGGGGYFAMIFEGDDPATLRRAVEQAAVRVGQLPEVHTVTYKNPTEFAERFKYLLLNSEQLEEAIDVIAEWKVKGSVLDLGLDDEPEASTNPNDEEEGDSVIDALERFDDLREFHQNDDGRLMGMIIRPKKAVTSLGATRALFGVLQGIANEVGDEHGLWSGVGGSSRNKVDIYDQLLRDLNTSGGVAAIAILLTLTISFRSVRVLPVLLLPLAVSLLWSFSLVPTTVGSLNLITSFLLMVLFGMGIDYAIHLVKRYQLELDQATDDNEAEEALAETFRSSGRSVATSGLTTALAFAILCLSDFRGFSEFGLISTTSMLLILVAMFLVLPAAMVVGRRLGLLLPVPEVTGNSTMPARWATAAVAIAVVVAAVIAVRSLAFDYDFGNLQVKIAKTTEVKRRQSQVYVGSRSPAAIYAVRDLSTLDQLLAVLEADKRDEATTIGKIESLRDYAPAEREAEARVELFEELQEETEGRWIERVDEPDRRRWIEEARDFEPPPRPPVLADLPKELRRAIEARDGSGELLVGVYPRYERKHGKNAMAFTAALYGLDLPAGVRGPTGETPVFAEILWLVTGEAPWIIGLTFAGIFVLVLADRRSLTETLWVLLPLVSGFILTLGAMTALGWKLNFFNIVVLPTMLGIAVDQGVHFYRRWDELGSDTLGTQRELFAPLTSCAVTTIMGYAGMTLAHHPGLEGIGKLAVLGLGCCWLTAVVLMPGLLRLRELQLARTPVELGLPLSPEDNN